VWSLSLLHSFPTRRSSDLVALEFWLQGIDVVGVADDRLRHIAHRNASRCHASLDAMVGVAVEHQVGPGAVDRLGEKVTAQEWVRSEEHTSELQSPDHLVCR